MAYSRPSNLSPIQKAVQAIGIVLLFVALSCLYIGKSDLQSANRTKPTVHVMTAAELIAHGPGDNAYVRIEQATPLIDMYVAYRDRSGNENWKSYIYVPLAPLNASPTGQTAPRIFLRTNTIWEKPDLVKLKEAPSFEGIVYTDSLTASAEKLIKGRFPSADPANCYVIHHNARPRSKPAAIIMLVLGSILAIAFLLVLVVWMRIIGPAARG